MQMEKINRVYIGVSLDGYIADKEGKIEYLDAVPHLENNDMNWGWLMQNTDALLMGRTTFETVLSFGVDWPYSIPVYVLSTTLTSVPKGYENNVFLVTGTLKEVLEKIHSNAHTRLYIDGGSTIQSFLRENLIDEMIITTIPILIGGGTPLFGDLAQPLLFECVGSEVYDNGVVQNRFRRRLES